jgi:membrane-associated phospholipid phosphatase
MKETLARLITNVFNPFLVSFTVIVLLAFEGTHTTADALKWVSISLALSVLPLLVVVIFLVRRKKLDGVFENPRGQRIVVYLLAVALGATGYVLLRHLYAPKELVATFASGLASVVFFTVINFLWKISVHTAFLAGAIMILIMVYGAAGAWAVLLLPPMAWARVELKQHSWSQAAAGAVIAAAVVVLIFWGYGIVG